MSEKFVARPLCQLQYVWVLAHAPDSMKLGGLQTHLSACQLPVGYDLRPPQQLTRWKTHLERSCDHADYGSGFSQGKQIRLSLFYQK